MWRLILLALGQSALMVACQLLQKIALNRAGDFAWNWGWFCRFFANFYMIGSGLCFAATAFCWLYMLKRYPFSMVAWPTSWACWPPSSSSTNRFR